MRRNAKLDMRRAFSSRSWRFLEAARGMFDKGSEADMGLHFTKVGEFDAAAPLSRLQTVCPSAPTVLRFISELLHPDEWGEHRKIDVPRKSGVLV